LLRTKTTAARSSFFGAQQCLNSLLVPTPDIAPQQYLEMVWGGLIGSLKLYVSFAKEPYKRNCAAAQFLL